MASLAVRCILFAVADSQDELDSIRGGYRY